MFGADEPGVRNYNAGAAKFVPISFQKLCEVLAADFLLTLNDKSQITRKIGAGAEVRLDRF
jgi:hypothetical protein